MPNRNLRFNNLIDADSGRQVPIDELVTENQLNTAVAAVRSQEWNALVNYSVGEQVLFSGKRYYAVQASGPDHGGEQQPDPSIVEYWFEIPSVGTRAFEYLSVPVGAEIAFDTPPPANDPRFRFVKLTYNDAYNTGLLTSQTLIGSAPELFSTAVVSAALSPINGQTIYMINTMGTFIRPSTVAGIITPSGNKLHNHTDRNAQGGAPGGSVSLGSAFAKSFRNADINLFEVPPSGVWDGSPGGLITTSSGGSEARPYNISEVFYKRIY